MLTIMSIMLLNSSVSDEFSLGPAEEFISGDLENRIIRFKTNLDDVNPAELEAFFRTYDELEKVDNKYIVAMREFFLEKFFQKVRSMGLSEVNFFKGEPGPIQEQRNCRYQFIDNGKGIKFYDEQNNPVSEISRIVEITRGRKRHIIVCDPKVNKVLRPRYVSKLRRVQELFGGDYTISYMVVYASDAFAMDVSLSGKYLRPNPMYKSKVAEYLNVHDTRMVLVYSATSQDLAKRGREILSRIKKG